VRILVVEDEPRLASLLNAGLSEEGFAVVAAYDGEEALGYATSSEFDVILLDLNLPKMDGAIVARRLRQRGSRVPIVMLTARDSVRDIVGGLNLGADDYLTKPFSFEVLVARLRAIGRRGPIAHPVRLGLVDLVLDTETREVKRGDVRITLTAREYSLLELLLRHVGRPVSRKTILESIWGFESDVEENTLEAFVRLLRNKVDVPFEPKLIHTVRGVGYCMRLPEG
jgi:DNA-binding response OmpR family regulator